MHRIGGIIFDPAASVLRSADDAIATTQRDLQIARNSLSQSTAKLKAYMAYDECWYCMPCEADCPTGAVTVNIPYLLR